MAGMLLYRRTRTTIKKWGDLLVDKIKQSLKADRTYASGRTHNSVEGQFKATETLLTYSILSRKTMSKGKEYSVLEIIDQGRSPGGKPPMQAILYWMEKKGIQPRGNKGRFKKRSDSNMKQAAYAIATRIGQKGTIERFGYKGSDILGFVFKSREQQMTDDIVNSFELDLQDYIDKALLNDIRKKSIHSSR